MDAIEWIASALMLACAAGVALWTAGAVYYDGGRGAKWAPVAALGWLVAVVALFVLVQPVWLAFAIFLGAFALFLCWWLAQKPSHARDWDASVAVLPRATVRDGIVTVENVRNNEYRAFDDFTAKYETRSYNLANLRGVDVIFFNWGSEWMSHPVLVFDFGPDGRVCMSIEVRYRKGQRYSILRSLYRQQELIFTVADERDAILRRTMHGRINQAHFYKLVATPDEVRTAFLDYIDTINSIFEKPRWYHGLTANCTTNFYRLPNTPWRFDWRILANGRLDRALYERGRLDRSLPFDELKKLAHLNEIAGAAPADGFGDYIRQELARRRDGR